MGLAMSGTCAFLRSARSMPVRCLNEAINCRSKTSGVNPLFPLVGSLMSGRFAPIVTRPESRRTASSRPVSMTSGLAGVVACDSPTQSSTRIVTIDLTLFIISP